MVTTFAALLVLLTGCYLVGLAVLALAQPAHAVRFLGGFASSLAVHLIELALRFTAGVAILLYAPHMHFPEIFTVFGWMLVTTTILLLVLPWRLHQRFARMTVPRVTKHSGLLATVSLALGAFILLSIWLGNVN